jgi:hypothetical protein
MSHQEDLKTIHLWQEHTAEGREFQPTNENWTALGKKIRDEKLDVTPENLSRAYNQLLKKGTDLSRAYFDYCQKLKADQREKDSEIAANLKAKQEAAKQLREQQEAKARLEASPEYQAAKQAEAAAKAADEEKALFATWESGLPGMNSFQRLQYAAAKKDDYFRRKPEFARPEPSKEVHADVLRRQKADAESLARQQQEYKNRQNAEVVTASRAQYHSANRKP